MPYVDNWATCDQMSPKVFKKYREELLREIKKWLDSGETYTVRFAIKMLMEHFLDEDFDMESNSSIESDSEYNRIVAIIRSMPENYRTLFEMKFVLEYSNIEIAKALGITEDAVAARIYRGRKKLLKLLEKEGFTYE